MGLGVRQNRNTGKIKLIFFFFLWEIYWSDHTNTKILTAGVGKKLPGYQSFLCEHSIHSRLITKIFALLTPIKMSGLVFWGCPSWAMVCCMNTRSVCRICQINFNSERIWAVNTQEIALLLWAWSVIQEDGEQRRQEEKKACQGNWIICGIILSDRKFLLLLLNMLRWGQLECSIHVTQA